MEPSRLLGAACLGLLIASPSWGQVPDHTCPHPLMWKPTDGDLGRILSDHRRWVEKRDEERKREHERWAAEKVRSLRSERPTVPSPPTNSETVKLSDSEAANLCNADLREIELRNANLAGANLNNANLSKAQLKQANLDGVSLSGAQFSNANLAGARYAPVSGAPDPNVAGIKGLATVTFPHGAETGLVQLRDLLQKAGLRNLEREATFAIENGKTGHAIKGDNPGDVAEGYFRLMAFDWTTGYGLYPGRALRVIAVVWLLLILVYFWPIRLIPHRTSVAGIYQVWPSDRVETSGSNAAIGKSVTVNRLQRATVAALGYAAYFSLLSAFHIGWRDLNVGTWIARIQAREYALRATGWVRAVSGVQSLLSVYLLAMWALTYFGRPFQ